MHSKCFDEIGKRIILDPFSRQNGGYNQQDWLKSFCHHSLEICVFTQMVHGGRRKSIATEITLVTNQMYLSVVWSPFLLGGWVPTVNKSTHIHKTKGNEREAKRKECMVCSIQVIFWIFVLLCCMLHCILLGGKGHMLINPSK